MTAVPAVADPDDRAASHPPPVLAAGLRTLLGYKAAWLPFDLVAGVA